jgi:hypothetical protein
LQFCSTTRDIAIVRHWNTVDAMPFRAASDGATAVTGSGTAAQISHASHRDLANFEVARPDVEHFAAVRCGVAKPYDIFHFYASQGVRSGADSTCTY